LNLPIGESEEVDEQEAKRQERKKKYILKRKGHFERPAC